MPFQREGAAASTASALSRLASTDTVVRTTDELITPLIGQNPVASKSKIAKAQRNARSFRRAASARCKLCGRPRAVYRKFGICRICFRKLADQGLIPGVRRRVGKKSEYWQASRLSLFRSLTT